MDAFRPNVVPCGPRRTSTRGKSNTGGLLNASFVSENPSTTVTIDCSAEALPVDGATKPRKDFSGCALENVRKVAPGESCNTSSIDSTFCLARNSLSKTPIDTGVSRTFSSTRRASTTIVSRVPRSFVTLFSASSCAAAVEKPVPSAIAVSYTHLTLPTIYSV